MKLSTLVACVLLCIVHITFSQSVSTTMGARAFGMGNTISCLQDEWSLFNNPGGLAVVNNPTFAASYKVNPQLTGMNQMAGVGVVTTKLGVMGMGLYRFGDDLYNEQIATAGFSNTFGITSLGATINYIQYQAEGFGTRGIVSFNFGGITEITKNVLIGAFIRNLNQPYITEEKIERIPTIMTVGVGFKLSSKVFVTTELEKEIDRPLAWKSGMEYKPFTKVSFRAGFNLYPANAYFGAGFQSSRIKIDYAFQYSNLLGIMHQAGVGYQIIRS